MKTKSPSMFKLFAFMWARKTSRVDWKSVDGVFRKPRRLHLVEDSDGLIRCPIAGCDHPGFSSRRGCRKHAKTKHSWSYYFDEKPKLPEDKSLLTLARYASKEK